MTDQEFRVSLVLKTPVRLRNGVEGVVVENLGGLTVRVRDLDGLEWTVEARPKQLTVICDYCDTGNPVIENAKGYPASSYRPRCADCTCKSCGGSGLVVKERRPEGYVDYCSCPAGNAQMDDTMTSRRDREEDWFFERMGRE